MHFISTTPVRSPSSLTFVVCFLLLIPALLPGSPVQNLDMLTKVQAQQQATRKIKVFPTDRSVVDMSEEELLEYYPSELRRVQLAQSQDELSLLLGKVGERVQSFFQNLSNTSSRETVFIQKPGDSQGIGREFNYLVSYRQKGNKPLIQEYRTDKKNRPVDQNTNSELLITSGYVGLSLNFHPEYAEASRFRYLGRQKSDSRAYLIAFAQKPDAKDLQIEYTDITANKSIRVPVQGIVWVDPDTYQIMRLRINLLHSDSKFFITEQSTDLKLREIQFEGSQKPFWLPGDCLVETQIAGRVFRNQHRYRDYKLFDVSSDFQIDSPKPKN
jgi:hypothetical protein